MKEGIQRHLPQSILHPAIPGNLGGIDVVGGDDAPFIDSAVMGVEQHDRLHWLPVLGKDYRIIAVAGNPTLTLGEDGGRVGIQQISQGGFVMGVLAVVVAETQCPKPVVLLHEIGEFGKHFQAVEAEEEVSTYDRQVGICLLERFFK